MPDFLTPISDLCQTQLEASRRISDAIFSGAGKIDRVMLDAGHRAVDEQLRFAQAVGNTRDMQVLSNLQSTFWGAKPEQMQRFQQDFVRILSEVQNQLGRATQAYIEQFGTNVMRSMPFGMPLQQSRSGMSGMSGTNPVSSMMSAWDTTLRGMSQLSGQAIATARSGAQVAETVVHAGEQAVTESMESAIEAAQAGQAVFVQATEEAGKKVDKARSSNGNGNGVASHESHDHPQKDDKGHGTHRRK